MSQGANIAFYSAIWIVCFAITLVVTFRRRNTVGLSASFLMTFAANNWLGSALYVLPWRPLYPESLVLAGLEQSCLGIIGFMFGALVLAPGVIRKLQKKVQVSRPIEYTRADLKFRVVIYLLFGIVAFFLWPFVSSINVLNVFGRVMIKFAILGSCLFVYLSICSTPKSAWMHVLLVAALFPLVGILFMGFASFGTVISVVLIMFYFSYTRFDLKKALCFLLMGYFGVSAFVVYMDHRSDIRASVWGGDPVGSRAGLVLGMISDFELISWKNGPALDLIDSRLDGNYYVGLAKDYLDFGLVDYAWGRTVLDVFVGVIPRVLWREKPVISGGNELMHKYTGIEVYGSTSSGFGPVLEGYVNFGPGGVIGLFTLLGLVVCFFDAQCRRALDAGRFVSFELWFMMGFEFALVDETVAALVASIVSTFLVIKALRFMIQLSRGGYIGDRRVEWSPKRFG